MRILCALVVAVLILPVTPARAKPAELTWTVQPATAGGPDGRRWIERTLDPGQAVTEHLAVRNLSAAAAVFGLKAADGYLTDKGRFNMLPSDRPSKDGGTWIGVPATVTVPARATVVVPLTIAVPAAATPGDHPAGIAASIVSGTGPVQVESRVGFRVMMRVSGTLKPALSAGDLTARYERSWNPFRGGTVHIRHTVTNTGNVRVDGTGTASTSSMFLTRTKRADAGELLPGGVRTIDTRVGGVWSLGRVRTTVTVTPRADGEPATVAVWALPWPQLLLAVAIVVVLLPLRVFVRHRRTRLERMLAAARAEGRRTAAH
jgi:hypothetical protein